PMIRMADGPVGVRNYGESTAYPASIGLAASFNTDLAQKVGTSIGKEARAKNVHIMLGPAMNIHRGPMCGRNFEYLGEDHFLAGEIASNFIIGLQNEGVMATAKHYVANYQDFARHTVSSDMDERTLREIYLPAFKACVHKGKVASVMTAYNLVNGIHCSQHDFLNNVILKKEWGFEGFIMSDWTSTYDAVGAANGGLDLEMPYAKFMNRDSLLPAIEKGLVSVSTIDDKVKRPAIEKGLVSVSTIDDKVKRMLRMIIKFGYLDNPNPAKETDLNQQACSEIALDVAREGIVLLKNKNILPLDKNKIKTIAVVGPNAEPAVTGGGGSSHVNPIHTISLKKGLEELVGDDIKILYSSGPFEQVSDDFYKNNNNFYNVTDQGKIQGLKAEIFNNKNLENSPVTTRVDKVIDFSFGKYIADSILCQNVSVRWTGKIQANESGKYKFVLSGDDGYKLYIDDKLMIDEWQDQSEKTTSKIINIEANKEYDILLEFYQGGGSASFRFGYAKYDPVLDNEVYDYAKKADAVVIAVGFRKNTESEGFDRTFELPKGQETFLNKILALNKNSVVVLFCGGNVAMQSWLPKTAALLHAFYPGQEGGQALAEIIFGETNPSGKLPVSFEKKWEDNPTVNSYFDEDGDKKVFFSEGVFLGYRYYDTKKVEPQFPFGFGLSYTTFDYSDCDIIQNADTTYTVKVSIKNTGKLYGKESVQVYVSDLESSVERPVKELKGFGKIGLNAGEEGQVEITVPKTAFSFFSEEKGKWIIEPGEFEILVGASSRDIKFIKKIKI
ncbi:MAG: glycoside hydrolase family 3 C-terminal domain-containing protein, partial [Calditrichaceae bacterium]